MPRITTSTVSNSDQAKELPVLQAQGKDIWWPPVTKVSK